MKLNMHQMLEQAQKVQQEMERIKKEISQRTVTADSGGGMVQVTMTGDNQVLKIKISPELIADNDIEMLEDLLVAAVNKATKVAQETVSNEMNRISGMLPNIPGVNFNI